MGAGRPSHFKDAKTLQKAIDDYFDNIMSKYEVGETGVFVGRPAVSELAYHLEMSTRSFVDYAHRDEFSPTIKRARQRIEMELEKNLYGNSVTGTIFNLKNNFGWKDKTEVDQNTTLSINEMSDEQLEAIAKGGS